MGNQRALINNLIENIKGGSTVAAAHLDMSISVFNDRRYENKGTRFFNCEELLALQELSGTSLVAEYFAEAAGCMVIKKMDAEQSENFDLFMMMMECLKNQGDLSKVIKESIENDGFIDNREASLIRKITDKVNKFNRSLSENVISLFNK